jgi:hypothetical protein
LPLLVLLGCGDHCEVLCQQAASRVAQCKGDALTWADLGARGKNDFSLRCRSEWDRSSSQLTATDLRVALEVCSETSRDLSKMTCDEIVALYAVTE